MSAPVRPIGCIADDITGATDLASALAGRGLDARLAFGGAAVPSDGGDAVVVALKIRSVPAADARAAAVDAATALRAIGVEQFFSKYCSTFDSTADGNIGPIADALLDLTGSSRVVHCPAYPANGRTLYRGHLFVGDELLSDSPMRDHPLTPMRESRLPRVLAEQTPREVGLVAWPAVDGGPEAVRARLDELTATHVLADAVRDADIDTIARATAGDGLAAGSAAYGAAFAASALERAGHPRSADRDRVAVPQGPAAILAGSLSRATREQVRLFDGPKLSLAVADLIDGEAALLLALRFAGRNIGDGALLIGTDYETAVDPAGADGLSSARVSERIEHAMGQIALALEELGVRRLIVAGGETSGAVADALSLRSARIGPDISVGVPWIVAEDRDLALAFKSGNFGKPSFFRDALDASTLEGISS